MSHTEGPWNIERLNGECRECDDTCTHTIDIRSHGRHVASILGPIWDNDEANAQLLAAAPDLLSAVKFAANEMRICDVGDGEALGPAYVRLREAIAKVEGQA